MRPLSAVLVQASGDAIEILGDGPFGGPLVDPYLVGVQLLIVTLNLVTQIVQLLL